MSKYKIYRLLDSNTIKHEIDYEGNREKTSAQLSYLLVPPKAVHLKVPDGKDPEHYDAIKGAVVKGTYEGVRYIADNQGLGPIRLSFDGTKNIVTIISDWNTKNPSNTIGHNAGNNKIVPTTGTLHMHVWDLEFKQDLANEKDMAGKNTQINVLKTIFKKESITQAQAVFLTISTETARSDYEMWKIMKDNPSAFSNQNLVSDRNLEDAQSNSIFLKGVALNTDQKIINYSTRLLELVQDYAVWRASRKQKLMGDIDIILS